MTTEELRVRVGELLGWKTFLRENSIFKRVIDPSGREWKATDPRVTFAEMMPDWPKDLNACHAFEEGMTEGEREDYILALIDLKEPYWSLVIATAEQRCRAFVRVKEQAK